ncbi:hypothetical protein [uncultured Brachyspira sp.]|uniref:hypothetical protein n=1 Tax=uncultured Brachyspira sp. TaxID=221953 RepID=UPI002614A340|nr:hypothetical protein [uncultured Brachyspira sp.]
MSKKISTIFLSLFLVGILSVSCSNESTTGTGSADPNRGIEQYNGNTYVSDTAFDGSSVGLTTAYLWVSIQNGQVATLPNSNNTTPPNFTGSYMGGITGSGTDYSFSAPDFQGTPDQVQGTLKFAPDGSTVTVNYSKNPVVPSFENKDFICNKK